MPRAQSRLAALALFVLVVAAYAPSLAHGFIYDDPVLFAETPVRRTLAGHVALFGEPHFAYLPYYRPVVRATFELQKLVHGSVPGPFHLVNALGAGVLAVVARRLLLQPVFRVREPFAWLAALVYALQPVVSSSVHPVPGRETLFATVLVLAATLGFLARRPAALACAALAFAVALLCHEQAIVLPVLLVLVDLADRGLPRRSALGRRAARLAPFALVALAYLALRARVLADAPSPELALAAEPLGPLASVGYALVSILAPTPGVVYEAPPAVWASAPRLIVAGVLGLGLVALVLRARRSTAPVPALAAGWFLVGLLPSANVLVQETRFAERWLALASFGAIAALAATASCATGRAARGWSVALALLALAAGGFSVRRGFDHADNRTFLTTWVRTNPASAQARSSLGTLLYGAGEVDVAELHLRKAVELNPRYADAHASLGGLLLLTDRVEEALPHLKLAVRLDGTQASYRYNLGSALARSGRLDAAERHLERAVQLAPGFAAARGALDEVRRLRAEGAERDAAAPAERRPGAPPGGAVR